ncbi:hypothetical protein [Streptosporangium vulgare]|uniref:hypothetical protein n=1 Tax=Streptosporangium vulgare TaxID=46190 RepID=UPI0031CFA7DC
MSEPLLDRRGLLRTAVAAGVAGGLGLALPGAATAALAETSAPAVRRPRWDPPDSPRTRYIGTPFTRRALLLQPDQRADLPHASGHVRQDTRARWDAYYYL